MKYYLIILLSLPFISFGQTSLFYKTKTTDVIATREVSKTVGLSMNVSFLEDILENSSNYLDVRIPFLDGDLELTLHRFSIINDQLLMISKTSSGEDRKLITPTLLSYKMFFNDINIGVLNIVNNEIVATFTINNKQYEISKFNNKYLLFEASNSINESNFSCQVESQYSSMNVEESDLLLNACVELAIEIDYYTRQTFNSDLETINWALAIISGVSQLYEAQTNASISVVNAFIWNTTDPYESIVNDASYMLSELKSYWQSNNNSISRDLVHLLSKRDNTGTGGIAYLNGMCSNNSGYAFSSAMDNDTTYNFPNPTYTWNLMVVTHEIGHNFGADHTHWCGWTADPLYNFSGGAIDNCGITAGYANDCNPSAPAPAGGFGTIMSYCHTGASGASGSILSFHDIVLSQAINPGVSSAACLTTCGEGCTDSLAFNYNPYSSIDNGTCCYISGCTNPIASNYDSTACVDDGICLFPTASFCDDFEGYQNGDPIAENSADWETWGSIASPTPPYYDDADVTNTLAQSGSNSLYFVGIGGGGPQDIVLPFGTGGPYTNGYFNFSANFHITNGAYFNFQAEQMPGVTWTTDVSFDNSNITISNTSPSSFTCNYTEGVWFEFKFEIDLSNNIWEVFIDGVSQGTFSNTVNQIASLDLYPLAGHQFYVDDVCFEFSNTPIGEILGCTDSLACNYNSLANTDDGSCDYPTMNTTAATECDSYTWTVNGNTYTASGTYTDISTNAAGCTHTETLNLTINNSTSNTTTLTECDSYTWTVNGNTYTTSGTYTDISTNAAGCTYTETLNLTINNSTSNTTTLTECDEYIWTVNGNTYTASGTYTDISTNAAGCTHTETLELTITSSNTVSSIVTACYSYTWDGVVYDQTGLYTNLYTNMSGCDSIHNLDLIVNDIYAINNTVDICSGDSITVANNTYDQTGTYTDLFTTVNGCDSIVTTQLTVYSDIISVISQNGNDIIANVTGSPPYLYEWSTGETTNQITPLLDGDYWVIVTDVNECISDTSFFTVDWIHTNIEDLNIDRLIIYPNPTEGIVNIKFNDNFKGSIMMHNILGELIFNETKINVIKNQTIQIDLSLFSKGIYFFRITNSNRIVNQKLIFE